MKPFKYCPHCGEKLMEDTEPIKDMDDLIRQQLPPQMPCTPYTPYPDPKPWIPWITWRDDTTGIWDTHTKRDEYK